MKYRAFLFLILVSCSRCKCPIEAPPCPSEWKEEATMEICQETRETFSAFEDDILDSLINQAINYNKTIDIAIYNLLEAKERVGVALGPLFPNITFDPEMSKREGQLNTQGFLPTGMMTAPLRTIQSDYRLSLTAVYEPDFFGKWTSAYMSAVHNQRAYFAAYRQALLLVASDTAQNYFVIRSLDAELDVLIQNIDILTAALEINTARYNAGLVTFVDVTRAESELAIVRSDYESTKRRRRLAENALAVLLGENASLYYFAKYPLVEELPDLTTPIPCELLSRRPDMKQRAEEVRRAAEDMGFAFGDLFPTITLAGSIGYESFSPSHLLDWQARFWSYTISLVQTVFDAGSKASEVEARRARLLATLANYYEQGLIAFREVEDALAEIRLRRSEKLYLVEAVKAAELTLQLTTQRYLRGLISYFDVVDAQRTYLNTNRSLVIAQGSEHIASVSLIKALGGGY